MKIEREIREKKNGGSDTLTIKLVKRILKLMKSKSQTTENYGKIREIYKQIKQHEEELRLEELYKKETDIIN